MSYLKKKLRQTITFSKDIAVRPWWIFTNLTGENSFNITEDIIALSDKVVLHPWYPHSPGLSFRSENQPKVKLTQSAIDY